MAVKPLVSSLLCCTVALAVVACGGGSSSSTAFTPLGAGSQSKGHARQIQCAGTTQDPDGSGTQVPIKGDPSGDPCPDPGGGDIGSPGFENGSGGDDNSGGSTGAPTQIAYTGPPKDTNRCAGAGVTSGLDIGAPITPATNNSSGTTYYVDNIAVINMPVGPNGAWQTVAFLYAANETQNTTSAAQFYFLEVIANGQTNWQAGLTLGTNVGPVNGAVAGGGGRTWNDTNSISWFFPNPPGQSRLPTGSTEGSCWQNYAMPIMPGATSPGNG